MNGGIIVIELIDKNALVNQIQKLFDEALLYDTKIIYALMKRMVEEQEVVEIVDTEKIENALKDIHDVADMSRQKGCALTSIGVEQIDTDCDIIKTELGKRPLSTGHWIVNEFDDNRLTPIRTCSICGNYLRIAVSPDFCCFCGSAMKDG